MQSDSDSDFSSYDDDLTLVDEEALQFGAYSDSSVPIPLDQDAKDRHSALYRQRVLDTLEFMDEKGLRLDILLDSVFYGDQKLRNNQPAKRARGQLTRSKDFPSIIKHLFEPPRTASKGRRAKSGSSVLSEIALEHLGSVLSLELEDFAHILYMHPNEENTFFHADSTETILKDISVQAARCAPMLSSLLASISEPESPKEDRVSVLLGFGCDYPHI